VCIAHVIKISRTVSSLAWRVEGMGEVSAHHMTSGLMPRGPLPPMRGQHINSATMVILECTCGWEGVAQSMRGARRKAARHERIAK
jgi:hypothetical protein